MNGDENLNQREFQLIRERIHDLANGVNTMALRQAQADGKLSSVVDTVREIKEAQERQFVTRHEFEPIKTAVSKIIGTLIVLGVAAVTGFVGWIFYRLVERVPHGLP